MIDERPWRALPQEVATVLGPELPELADEIIAAISRGVPDYRRPLEGEFGKALRTGVVEALRQFVQLVERPEAGRGPGREVYVNLGRGEMLAGRGLDALLAAYRLGARVAWRRLAAAGEAAGLEPRTLYLLAESIFAYIDELSAESIEGYTQEQAARAGEQQRLRRRLAALLVQQPAADASAVEAAAVEAGWPLPRELAAVVVEGWDADRLARRLDPAALTGVTPEAAFALLPDPDAPGRRAELSAALEPGAALGPTVGWPDAVLSLERAKAVLRLARERLLPADDLLVAADHAVPLLLHGDSRLSQDIAGSALAPLDELGPGARARLRETLEAWLRHRGRTERVAEALHVHPQTVRYRMAQLRELFGERLEDPDLRFELELALRATAPAA
jgi:PucR C-terminal helix-turn-helix domain